MSHLVVDSEGELAVGVGHFGGITEAVDRQTAYSHGQKTLGLAGRGDEGHIPIGGMKTLMSPRVIN